MVDVPDCMCFQVDDIYFALGHIHHDDFFIVHLSKCINDIVVFLLVENVALLVEVYDAFLLAGFVHSDHNKGVVVCS